MAMQPGMVPLPAFGAAADPDLEKDDVDAYGVDRAERDVQDGEPVGRSDRAGDVATDGSVTGEQAVNEDALESYLSGDGRPDEVR